MRAPRRQNAWLRGVALVGMAAALVALCGCQAVDDFRSALVATRYISRGNALLDARASAIARGDHARAAQIRAAALAAFGRAEDLRRGDRLTELLLVQRYALADAPERGERLLRSGAVSAHAYWTLGFAFFKKGDRGKGVKYCEMAVQAAPEDPLILNNVGFTYADYNVRLQEALRLVKKADLLKPDQDDIVDSVGWAYYRLGLFEQARPHLERAASMAPDNAEVRYHLGVLYSRLGLTEKAEAELRAALARNPAFGPAREELRRLRWTLPPPTTA